MITRKRAVFALVTSCLLLALMPACGIRRTPNLERVFNHAKNRRGKRPVIVIPGVLGSQLANSKTGEVVWPSAFRSSADELDLPTGADLAANRDDLVATRILDVAKFARYSPDVYVYYELLQALQSYGGYKQGNWDDPPADGDRDTFYVFAYDWRRDNTESARELARRMQQLKEKLRRPDLRFNLLAHSMGGLVARYAAMYGDADLPPEAESNGRGVPWSGAAYINRVFLFGAPNEGSAEAFASLIDGYSVTDGIRRRVNLLNKLSPTDIVTAPAAFQLMPHRGTERFFDQDLRPLEINLYDVETWRRYNWLTPETNLSDEYLGAVLRRARLFHQAIDRQTGAGENTPVRFYAFGGGCEETLVAPIILPDKKKPNRWTTLVRPRKLRSSINRELSRDEVTRAMFTPGDGTVTRSSLLGENLKGDRSSALYATPLPINYAVFACDVHGNVPNNKLIQDNALTILVSEAIE